jgi:2-amino-4-hydroxy-6-hydroxymethyldihydropteridine diphosphokinase
MGGWLRISKLQQLYLIGLGCNQRHAVIGSPRAVIAQAIVALEMDDIDVFAVAPVTDSKPIGPSLRQYANTAAIIASALSPPQMLTRLKGIEAHFGRRSGGQKWRSRVLDLDILVWSGGMWVSDNPPLAIPHAQLRKRSFVLGPANKIAPDLRDPVTGLCIKHLFRRLNRPKPLDAPKLRH